MEFGDLLDLENVAIIIPGPSGKEWNNQVGCVSCLQMGKEGWVEILWNVPTRYFGCETSEVARLKMQHQLRVFGGIFRQVLSVEGHTEAWLDVTFILTREYLAHHPEYGIEPGEEVRGILTYQNCD